VRFETLLHRPASAATKLAQSVHVPGRGVAKTVLVKAAESYYLAVLPATSRIDLGRLGQVLGVPASSVSLATAHELTRFFGDCEPGVIPPFGRLYGLTTLVDTSLSGSDEIVIPANLRHLGLRLRYRDFEAVESPHRARFASPIARPKGDAARS
jgi:Ala-tRNA(Pro) deacylase